MNGKKASSLVTTITVSECRDLAATIGQWDVPKKEKELVLRALSTLMVLFDQLASLKMTIKQMRQLFKIKTEKAEKLYPPSDDTSIQEGETDSVSEHSSVTNDTPKKRKGHGRCPAGAYDGASTITIAHETHRTGDRCPHCRRGNLYDVTGPGFVHIEAQAPLQATIYKQQKFRCSGCGSLFHAALSDKIATKKKEKYAPSARAMIALLKYGNGFPLYRLAGLQHDLSIPLPVSTQWDILNALAERIYPVYEALWTFAAQGTIMFNDDTGNRIVKALPPEVTGHDKNRTGIFTTGLISRRGTNTIALYCTGRNHAGENLAELLKQRLDDRAPPIQMCDAAARNIPKNKPTLLAHCLVHGRRKFVELLATYPEACRHVIEQLAQVFHHDKQTQQGRLTPQQRLIYHQQKTAPIMNELKEWMTQKIDTRQVEPNSSLGGAFAYMLNHWDNLTLFLRIPDTPIDSNIVEQALKKVVLLRKNAYFFRTEKGAQVGDLFMTLIETCRLAGGDPFHYLTTLQQHLTEINNNPQQWFPWNYLNNSTVKKAA